MGKRLQLFGFVMGILLLAGSALWWAQGSTGSFRRLMLGGRPLLELRFPEMGQQVSFGSVEVIVAFPSQEKVLHETFRCLLNDQDVTDRLTLGRNGAAGSLYGLLEGENRLRIEVFGRAWWGGSFLEDSLEVRFRAAPMPRLDRA